jgi:hypothetical protein
MNASISCAHNGEESLSMGDRPHGKGDSINDWHHRSLRVSDLDPGLVGLDVIARQGNALDVTLLELCTELRDCAKLSCADLQAIETADTLRNTMVRTRYG